MRKSIVALIGGLVVAGFAVGYPLVQTLGAAEASNTGATTTQLAATSGATEQTAAQAAEQAGDTTTTITATAAGEVLAANQESHADANDGEYDEDEVVTITLADDASSADGEGVTIEGNVITISAAGTYSLSGTLSDGQVVVNSEDEEKVRLVLNGVDLHSSTGSPLAILAADEVVIVLADGSENLIADEADYVFPSADVDEPNAALYSAADTTITGSGALAITANYNDGIGVKDGLVIQSGTITVTAVDDGIRGKDYLIVQDGKITVDAGGDALKADNDEEAERGYISIEGGTLNITAGGDGFDAETDVVVTGGTLEITAGGGAGATLGADDSAKGIKGNVAVVIEGGTITVDAADDAVHSNGTILVNEGVLTLATGDDGIHADVALTINGGETAITESYEGIESGVITINDGALNLVASDDGINVSGSSTAAGFDQGGPGGQGTTAASYTGANFLYINGGYVVVDAAGDGIDVNGAFIMTDGVVLVNGPTGSGNGALDYDGGFDISGGTLVTAGSAGMAQAPGTGSTQNSIMVNFSSGQTAGTLVQLLDSAGEPVIGFTPTKPFQSIVFSSPDLATGESYTVSLGGSNSGESSDGLVLGGTYTAGTSYASLTLSSVVTTSGAAGMGGGMGGGRRGTRP